jgi:hypothetical protein
MAQYWVQPLSQAHQLVGGFTAVNNFAAVTSVTTSATTPDVSLPAGYAQAGMVFRVRGAGVYSTTGTPTLTLGVATGTSGSGTFLCSVGTATGSGVTNVSWEVDAIVKFVSVGSSGQAWAVGHVIGVTANLVTTMPASGTAPTAVTVNTTAAVPLWVGANWSAASASNTITCYYSMVEQLF